jgi:hypothetical protein
MSVVTQCQLAPFAKLLEWMTPIGWEKKDYQQKKPKFDLFALYFYFRSESTDPFL